ncbi:alpha-amylase family glycosyl hydrolase [Roseospira visakhapatnamensis]|uniref:Starch synthase (Maltosyl-transferring) n=1 Tax=Roseospira visakhapatnamensis TaxID=390880 RepID=A0A7W6W8W4_9PROT|nr:alpha-amylase family glycosyl hydrolase [Roseospira visakhapatnamensis]MBB4265279.1 starch synthase (maltosyl-transferring) [Roseospira visakhapatnamensis]
MPFPPVAHPAPRIYNLFPLLSGPVSRWTGHLSHIAAMGFDWVYVNPFHYPGFSGSLYAVKAYDRLHPLLDEGSGRSVDDQLRSFLEAARAHGLKVMLDLVINHTAKDSPWVTEHPTWYVRDRHGEVESPFAIDPANADNKTVWGDLAELDYTPRPERAALVNRYRAILCHFVDLGFAGFRCDAAYKVPADVWADLIGAARDRAPEALFAAETLGCRLKEIEGLRPAGFDYLFNSSKWWDFKADWLLEQYNSFRSLAPSIAFPESHDTPRLRAELPGTWPMARVEAAYKRAWLFAALFSSGAMMPQGYEFGFVRKPDVVRTRPEHWEDPAFDISDYVGAVNDLKRRVRVLNWEGPQRQLTPAPSVSALIREAEYDPDLAVTLINLDLEAGRSVPGGAVLGQLREDQGGALREVTPRRAHGVLTPDATVLLAPGEIRVFVKDSRTAP